MGVNKYKLEKEEEIDVLIVDNTKVRESQVIHLFSYILWKRLVGFCVMFSLGNWVCLKFDEIWRFSRNNNFLLQLISPNLSPFRISASLKRKNMNEHSTTSTKYLGWNIEDNFINHITNLFTGLSRRNLKWIKHKKC